MKIAIICCVLAVACHARPVRREPPATAPAPVATAHRGTGPSLYDLAIRLARADGTQVSLDVDRGHPILISMFYGSCPAACPVLVETIGSALDRLPAGTRVLLVSFDPARDTPARLRELAHEHHLDDRWTLAAASDADARTLAAVLGIRYRAVAGGQFFHTSSIVALDADGRIITRMDGIGDPTPLITALAN